VEEAIEAEEEDKKTMILIKEAVEKEVVMIMIIEMIRNPKEIKKKK